MSTNQSVEGFTNSILICVDCGEEFVFTASAQKYFAERGFTDPPKRCKSCYMEFKDRPNGARVENEEEQMPPVPPPTKERRRPGLADQV